MKARILKIGALQIAICTICLAAWADQDTSTPAQAKQDPSTALNQINSQASKPAASLSPWAAQVAKLAEARISEDIILSYLDTAGTFNLTAEQIIKLSDSGVTGNVISAMIRHDAEIISGCKQVVASLCLIPALRY